MDVIYFYLGRKGVALGAQPFAIEARPPPPPPNCGNPSLRPTKIRPHFGEKLPPISCMAAEPQIYSVRKIVASGDQLLPL